MPFSDDQNHSPLKVSVQQEVFMLNALYLHEAAVGIDETAFGLDESAIGLDDAPFGLDD
jgi:hypothetical protein